MPGAHKIGATISGPRITGGTFMDTTLFLNSVSHLLEFSRGDFSSKGMLRAKQWQRSRGKGRCRLSCGSSTCSVLRPLRVSSRTLVVLLSVLGSFCASGLSASSPLWIHVPQGQGRGCIGRQFPLRPPHPRPRTFTGSAFPSGSSGLPPQQQIVLLGGGVDTWISVTDPLPALGAHPLPPNTLPGVTVEPIADRFLVNFSQTLRAKGTLTSEPRFSTPCETRFFPREKGKTAFSKKNPRQRPFCLSRVGKIASRRGQKIGAH